VAAILSAPLASAQYLSDVDFVVGPGQSTNDYDDGTNSFTRTLTGIVHSGFPAGLDGDLRTIASFSADSAAPPSSARKQLAPAC
jgi:hypothetical protein